VETACAALLFEDLASTSSAPSGAPDTVVAPGVPDHKSPT